MDKIAGIILAGGRSSRMGRNKSLLVFQGLPLVEHMQKALGDAGLPKTYISGALEGYDTIPDAEPLAGPARAMTHLLQKFSGQYERLLFIPVDMPFIGGEILCRLAASSGSVFIKDHPFPNCLATRQELLTASSVKGLLEEAGAVAVDVPGAEDRNFLNLNTPEEWEKWSRA